MTERARYYSKSDLSIPEELKRANAVISQYGSGWRPAEINDFIELFNIWQFETNGVRPAEWTSETSSLIRSSFKEEIAKYFASLSKESWVEAYRKADHDYKECFWTIIDKFNIDGLLNLETVRTAISDHSWELRYLLKQKRLVIKNQMLITTLLKENEHSAEWLLQEYLEERRPGDEDQHLYFPQTLTFKDKEDILSRYLDFPTPNLNYVNLLTSSRKDSNLRVSDELRLKAIKVAERLRTELFSHTSGTPMKCSIMFYDGPEKPLKWVEEDKDGLFPVLCYSRDKMLACQGASLLHYISKVFEFLTPNGHIALIPRTSEVGTIERTLQINSKYSYPTPITFQYNEAISLLQIMSMQIAFEKEGKGRSIESAVKVFYEQYLKERYGYPSTSLTLADNNADWITKCRVIAPEIDAVAHRYNLFAKTGHIDEDLLRISSERVKVTEVMSAVPNRYYAIKGQPKELEYLFVQFFSARSLLIHIDKFKNQYSSFFQLLRQERGHIRYSDYKQYQQYHIDKLICRGLLSKDSNGMLSITKPLDLLVLKQFYEYRCCPAHTYGTVTDRLLEDMKGKGWLESDNHLLSEEERKYFEYYLYNTLYTNGPALRNNYVHGSNADSSKESVHRNAYYRLLILLILELLKIEEDLKIKQIAHETN